MRGALETLLAAPGLTRGRFIALAVVSLLATTTVVAAAVRQDDTPYSLLAAAHSRPGPVVEVARSPAQAATAAPAAVDDSAPATASDSAPAAAPVDDTFATAPPIDSTPAATPLPVTPATPPAVTPVAKVATKVKHVFVVDLAGNDHDATWGDASVATYLNKTLRPQGVFLGGYHGLDEGDLASLIALTSGQKPTPDITQGCPQYSSGCVFPVETLSLPDQLVSKGLRWRAYEEDLSSGPDAAKSCRHPANGADDPTAQGRPGDEYSTRHNPFVYYRSLTELGECTSNDLPLDALTADLASPDATPNFSFIAPNLCNGGWEDPCADGSAGGLAAADAFLSKWVPQILDSAAYKADGMLIVLTGSGVLAVSQFLPAGASDTSDVGPYSVLQYVEDLFGLDYLGEAKTATALTLALPRH